MPVSLLRKLAALVLLAAGTIAPLALGGDLIDRELFFGHPVRTAVRLSPDGTRVSYLAPHEGVLNVWICDRAGGDARPVTTSTGRPIASYFWMANGEQIIFAKDQGGNENYQLTAVDVATGTELALTPAEGVLARVVAADRDFPDTLLVAVNDRVPQFHDVWRVNTRSGERTLALQNDEGFVSFAADGSLNVRVATRFRRDGGLTVLARDSAVAPWFELIRWDAMDTAVSEAVGVSRDGERIYLIDSRGRDTGSLCVFHTAGENAGAYDLIATDSRADVSDLVIDPVTGRPQAVSFDAARRTWNVLDPKLAAVWSQLEAIAHGEMSIISRDHRDENWIVGFERDDGPYTYYLYDRRTGRSEFLFSNRPALDHVRLARMEAVTIPARDGLPLVSYLTRPLEAEPGVAGPMVLLVHGGPWARDHWGYNALHQWLANRGYVVLSVNFRGSTGFGKAFLNAGNGEWAGAMQDDLVDAVNWAVDQGIAAPNRVAIMGGSYGGYAALVGLTFTPTFFAAAVDIVGPSDVGTLIDSIPPYWEPVKAMFEARVGPLDDAEFLDAISPLSRVDAIERPLLIGQGANDPRVKEAESRQIVDAMKARSIPVTYVVFPDEGHGFRRPENAQAFFAITEAFLARHLGGTFQAMGSVIERSSADIQAGADLIPGLDGEQH